MLGHSPPKTDDPSQPGDILIGDWLVQPTLNRAWRHGTLIHLRPQLVDLLVCLAQSPGRTVSRETLLAQVWCRQSVAETAIARCVAELRQALGDNAQSPAIIETIPKRGYRLIAHVAAAGVPRASAPSGAGEAPPVGPLVPSPPRASLPAGMRALSVVATALAHALSVWTRRG